jgi:hypothetical protein
MFREETVMAQVTAAKLYKATSNVDYVILPAPTLTIPSGGDYEELRFRVAAADESAHPFDITARIARTLVTTSGWKPMEFLLRTGTLVAMWLIEQESFTDLTPLFHTGNTDKTGGLEAALGRWKTGLFEQEAGRRPIGFAADFAGYHGAQAPARLSTFPIVTVDYTVQLGDEHRCQLGVLIENPHGGQVHSIGVDIWFASQLMAGSEGFSGLGTRGARGIQDAGYRWRSTDVLFAGDHVRVCPTKETKLSYRVNDELSDWISEKGPMAEFEFFAGDFPRLRALVPVRRLHQF